MSETDTNGTSKVRAFVELKRFGKMFGGLIALAEEIDGVATLEAMRENAEAQLNAVLTTIKERQDAADTALAAMVAEIDAHQRELIGLAEKATAQRALLAIELADHETAAEGIKSRAHASAAATAKDIIAKAEKDAASSRQLAVDAMTQLLGLNKNIELAKAELAGVQAAIDAITDRLVPRKS